MSASPDDNPLLIRNSTIRSRLAESDAAWSHKGWSSCSRPYHTSLVMVSWREAIQFRLPWGSDEQQWRVNCAYRANPPEPWVGQRQTVAPATVQYRSVRKSSRTSNDTGKKHAKTHSLSQQHRTAIRERTLTLGTVQRGSSRSSLPTCNSAAKQWLKEHSGLHCHATAGPLRTFTIAITQCSSVSSNMRTCQVHFRLNLVLARWVGWRALALLVTEYFFCWKVNCRSSLQAQQCCNAACTIRAKRSISAP